MGLLTFTGHPFLDLGAATIAMMCKKYCFEEVTKEDIIEHMDTLLEVVKDHYDDSDATAKEKEYIKRGLRQHFTLMYNVNHYLFGINNKIENPKTGKKESVQTGSDFIKTFKQEVMQILEGIR